MSSFTPAFTEPTDEEISDRFGGVPVLSFRPEDLPHFRPASAGPYPEDALAARAREAARRFKAFCPTWNEPPEKIAGHAGRHNSQVLAFKCDGRATHFAILRPSRAVTPDDELSLMTGIPSRCLDFGVKKSDVDFVDVEHEAGHIDEEMRGVAALEADGAARADLYASELCVESAALRRYLDKGGAPATVERLIAGRAVAGFTLQTSAYFIAPALRAAFIDAAAPLPDFDEIFLAYNELRFRALALLAGDGVQHYSSDQIHRAIRAWDDLALPSGEVGAALERTCDLFDSAVPMHREGRRIMLAALRDVLTLPKLHPATLACGAQIIEAARLVTPDDAARRRLML